MTQGINPEDVNRPELQPEANVSTIHHKPPQNDLPNRSNHLHTLMVIVIVSLCVLAVGGISYGIYVVNDATTSISTACSQKVQTATHQAQQQAEELQGVTLFGSGPKITKASNDDCIDGDGTGSAMAAYQVSGVTLTQANNGILKSLGGTETPLTLSGNGDTNSQEYNDNDNSGLIHSLSTTVITSGNKTYDIQFLFKDVYDCPNVCDTGNDIVQTYSLQNESIREVDVEAN
jgi:hypothetical protein